MCTDVTCFSELNVFLSLAVYNNLFSVVRPTGNVPLKPRVPFGNPGTTVRCLQQGINKGPSSFYFPLFIPLF